MTTLELVLRVLLVLDAIALIGLVLLQQGRGASMGAAFGSGASQTLFGSAGATSFLTQLTAWLAVAFFAIALGLAWTARERAETMGAVSVPEAPTQERRAPSATGQGEATPPAEQGREVPSGPGADGARSQDGGTGSEGEVPRA